MSFAKPLAITLGALAIGGAAAFLLLRGPKTQAAPPVDQATPYQSFQNLGPGSGTATPLSRAFGSSTSHKNFDAEVRFFDMNGLASSDPALTTKACTAHGSAQLFRSSKPILGRQKEAKAKTKTGWCFLCSRASDEKMWRIHPDPAQVTLSTDSPTPFSLTATDMRKGRDPGATVIVQCVVCSKKENAGEVAAPDQIQSAIGASEVRSLTINAPIGPTAIVESVNGSPVDSTQFISSPRVGVVVTRIRNLPADTQPYLVTEPFNQTKRFISLLRPQNGLAGDHFIGTAVLGGPSDAGATYQRYWLTVVVSHRKIQDARLYKNLQALPVSNGDWDSQYAPLLQPVSEEPVVVKRLPASDPSGITLNIDGAEPGQGNLNGTPVPIDKYFDVFGEVDLPQVSAEAKEDYQAWVLFYREADFDQYAADPTKAPIRQERARISDSGWTLPWASLPNEGRYVVVAVLTDKGDSPPQFITDPSVKAYSQPKLVEFKKAVTH